MRFWEEVSPDENATSMVVSGTGTLIPSIMSYYYEGTVGTTQLAERCVCGAKVAMLVSPSGAAATLTWGGAE